jgi:adenine phosphoribosyltransferase
LPDPIAVFAFGIGRVQEVAESVSRPSVLFVVHAVSEQNRRALVVDDVLATGGTAQATAALAAKLGAVVCGYAFLLELGFLKGRDRLASDNVFSLITYA